MNLLRTAAVAAILSCISGTAYAAQSIVGTWALDQQSCTPSGGLISIGAKSLTADAMACRFVAAARTGDVVTWRGRCSDGTSRTPAIVVGALSQGGLTVIVNGNRTGPYRRCTPNGG